MAVMRRNGMILAALLCGTAFVAAMFQQWQVVAYHQRPNLFSSAARSSSAVSAALLSPLRSTPATRTTTTPSSAPADNYRSAPTAAVSRQPTSSRGASSSTPISLDLDVTADDRQVSRERFVDRAFVPVPTVAAPVELASATMTYRPGASEAPNIVLAAQRINGVVVVPGAESSFLAMLGELSLRAGFVAGEALEGGKVVQSVGGGVCVVSTLLYRAAFSGGLEIIERRGHSLLLSMFNEPPGMDAAVFTPDGDFRWRNDTASPIEIRSSLDPQANTITVSLWGHPDGRTTSISSPVGQTVRRPPAIWRFDPTVPGDAVREEVAGKTGLVTSVTRTVTRADGSVLHDERVVSRYASSAAVVSYGRNVSPPSGVIVVTTPEPAAMPTIPPTTVPTPKPMVMATVAPTITSMIEPSPPTIVPLTATPLVEAEPGPIPTLEQPTPTVQPTEPLLLPTLEPVVPTTSHPMVEVNVEATPVEPTSVQPPSE